MLRVSHKAGYAQKSLACKVKVLCSRQPAIQLTRLLPRVLSVRRKLCAVHALGRAAA